MERVKRDIKVAVLAGGTSSEREISLNSGKNAQAALCEAGYEHVDLLDPAQDRFLDSIRSEYDVAFLALHGAGGEDGQIQHVLAYLGIPYTGSMPRRACSLRTRSSRRSCMNERVFRLPQEWPWSATRHTT